MKDFILEIKVKNGRLLNTMRKKGYETAAELSRACGVSGSIIGDYLNLKQSPLKKNGDWKQSIIALSEELRAMPCKLFPEEFVDFTIDNNKAEINMSCEDIKMIGSFEKNPQVIIEDKEISERIKNIIDTLTEREQQVLKMHFGIGGEVMTFEKMARFLDVSRERVRQIEKSALKKLRKPPRARYIQGKTHNILNETGEK